MSAFVQVRGQAAAFLGQVEGAVGGLFGHFHHVVQARAGVGEFAGLGRQRRQFAQRLAQLARQPAEPGHHRFLARRGKGVNFPPPTGLVAAFQRRQRILQALRQQALFVFGGRGGIHQALAASRSKILPSFSSRVCAVNGLMM